MNLICFYKQTGSYGRGLPPGGNRVKDPLVEVDTRSSPCSFVCVCAAGGVLLRAFSAHGRSIQRVKLGNGKT